MAVEAHSAAVQVSAETTPLPIVISFIINLRYASQPIPPIEAEAAVRPILSIANRRSFRAPYCLVVIVYNGAVIPKCTCIQLSRYIVN